MFIYKNNCILNFTRKSFRKFTCGLMTLVGFKSNSNSGSLGFSASFSPSLVASDSLLSLVADVLSSYKN